MSTNYLVLTDVDAIQRYVFSSVRLAAIVGASGIVSRFDDELRQQAIDDHHAATAVVNGGNGLFVFPDQSRADDFAAEAVRKFRADSVSGSLTASVPCAFEDEAGYPAALRKALADLDQRKRAGTARPELPGLGLARACQYCGSEPAGPHPRKKGDEQYFVGAACARKLAERDRLAREAKAEESQRERDFNELAGDDYLAIIVIDGDGLGNRLRTLQNPTDYGNFSDNVKRVLNDALAAGFARLQAKGGDPSEEAHAPGSAQLLYHGGDDLVLACPGRWALPFIESFSASLQAADWDWALPQGRIGFSGGVTIARSGFPFRMAHAIAGELLRNAKRAAQQRLWPEGAVDFAVISEASGDGAAILAERELRGSDRSALSLTGRPYRLDSREPHSLSRLRQACAALKQFPISRLFDLRNTLTASALSDSDELGTVQLATRTARLADHLRAWESRLQRVPDLNDAWTAACSQLPLDAQTYAQGDLADAMYLWETCLGNPDSTHD